MSYNIVKEIGRGGMGCVFEATDPTGNRVALKMMSAKVAVSEEYRDLFYQEVRSLRNLDNPSVVKIVGDPFSDTVGNLYLPMEYVEGQTLSSYVERYIKEVGIPLPEAHAVSLFSQILEVFSYIHSRGCIHRDVKPSNIMLRNDGSICIIDFGIAKDARRHDGKTIGRVMGTDGYMSPEQAKGLNIDHRTDIYSLGCLLHFMLTGKHAIQKRSNDFDTVETILNQKFPLVSDENIQVSAATQNAILMAVDKNMMLRFQTADAFRSALTGASIYYVSVGRTQGDIIVPGNHVSGSHLDISFEPIDKDWNSFRMTMIDHSTNGTGVDGRRIHNEPYRLDINTPLSQLMTDPSALPQVFLAGLSSYQLQWNEVLNALLKKTGKPVSQGTGQKPAKSSDKLNFGFGLLCFLIPLVGWILAAIWKSEYPKKSTQANTWAFIGFAFNLIMYKVAPYLL